MILKKVFYTGVVLCLSPLTAFAQQSAAPPAMADLEGDHIIINYKIYEEQTYVSEVRNFTIEMSPAESEGQADSLLITGFYMKGSVPFKAAYSPATGNITIPAGTKIFGYSDGQGTVQTLYGWDEENSEVTTRPIVYRYQGDGTWKCSTYLVLRSGEAGSTSYTYYDFSQASRLVPANGTTSNVTYDGDQTKFVEKRPSYVLIDGNNITVYNLLQKDSYGYGCWLTLYQSPGSDMVVAAPTLIGSASSDLDFPYKALTGCEYDSEECRPDTISYAGTQREGYIYGTYDSANGTITLSPMAVWPAAYDDTGAWSVDLTRFYEVEESVCVSFDVNKATLAAISSPVVSENRERVRVAVSADYFDLQGRRIPSLEKGKIVLRHTTYSDGTSSYEKIILP